MAIALSSSDEENLIKRKLEVNLTLSKDTDIIETFELEKCVSWIQETGVGNVTLQFPDSLLAFAPRVTSWIQDKVSSSRISILGDTSYGECCVDEVAAEHIGAEAVIHFGHSCLTKTRRLPVLYVFTSLPLDINDLSTHLSTVREKHPGQKITLFYDVPYHTTLSKTDIGSWDPLVFLCEPVTSSSDDRPMKLGRICLSDEDSAEAVIFYVGTNESLLLLLALSYNKNPVYNFNPATNDLRMNLNGVQKKLLMKRYFFIEKIKDAGRIGLLVGTLGVSLYKDIIERTKTMIKESGKKSYMFLLGKPNVPKLANFPEIDVFVLIACPENSLIDDKEYLKPIVTPFEVDLALNKSREWTGEFTADFQELLPGQRFFKEFAFDADESDVSLVTGRIRSAKVSDGAVSALVQSETSVVSAMHQGAGGQFLQDREWKGLEQKLGDTPAALAVKGNKGIAMKYDNEESY